MNLNSVVRLALCVALMAAPSQAADCTKKELEAHQDLIDETGLLVLCGPNVVSITASSALLACTKPKCVEAMQLVVNEAPKCSPPLSAYRGMVSMLVPFDITFRGLVRMCENEKKQVKSTTSGSGSMDAVVGGNATVTTGKDDQAPKCTIDDLTATDKLNQSPELVQACGNGTVPYSSIQDSPLCSKPECMTYMKGRYMGQLPVCNVHDGSSTIGVVKLYEAICQVASEPAPEPSGASITAAVSSLVSFAAVAAARLIII